MQQYVIFNVLKEYCIPKEEEELVFIVIQKPNSNKVFLSYLSYLMVDLFSTQLSLASYTFPELQRTCRRSVLDLPIFVFDFGNRINPNLSTSGIGELSPL